MEPIDIAKSICLRLTKEGYIAYFAGGWVRDYLLGHPSADIDIATSAPLERVMELFPKTILVGLAFGVVIVQEEGVPFEVAAFRKDLSYTNGRRPDGIAPSTPEEDAERRDFTLNGMFYDPLTEKVYDFVGGKADLEKGVIRAIGNPDQRFVEDRLRMIRAVRFSARFGFPIEPATEAALLASAPTLFPAVAMERIYQELVKMDQGPHFSEALIDLGRLALLDEIFPSLKPLNLAALKEGARALPENIPLVAKLRELLKFLPLAEQQTAFRNLKVSAKELELIDFLYKAELNLLNKTFLSPSDWARFYAHPSSEIAVILYGNKEEHEKRRLELEVPITRLRTKKPLVTSDHLKKSGVLPGKEMGALLKQAETLAIDQNINDPETVLALLMRKNA